MPDQPHTASRPPLAARGADLEQLERETWDLLIVGGGIVGCGALLDAASRGLRAALIEQDDVAVGTSSRSSRLIHGGLRYLEQFHVGLVREALHERARLLELAPHLVRLEKFLFPLYGRPVVTRSFFDAGLTLMQRRVSAAIGEGLIYDMRAKVFRHIQSMPISFFSRTQTGALVSRLNNDIIGAQQAFTDLLSNVVGNIVVVVLVLSSLVVSSTAGNE